MTDDQKNQPTNDAHPGDITRRNFATLLVGAGLAATVQSAATVGFEVIETDVEVKTPDELLRRRIHSPENGFSSGSVDLARRVRLAAFYALHCQAYCF